MDKQTFSEQVMSMGDSLYRVARTILRSPADCEDAVQEAVAKAWEKRGALREERYFRTWLTRIVLNECYALCRRQEDTVPLDSCTDLRAPHRRAGGHGIAGRADGPAGEAAGGHGAVLCGGLLRGGDCRDDPGPRRDGEKPPVPGPEAAAGSII